MNQIHNKSGTMYCKLCDALIVFNPSAGVKYLDFSKESTHVQILWKKDYR